MILKYLKAPQELLSLRNADVKAALRSLWKDIIEAEESKDSKDSNRRDSMASSMSEWNDLSKILSQESDANEANEDLRRQECSEELFVEDADGQSSEWLNASVSASFAADDNELRHWRAAAAAYGSLVDDVLEICDDSRPDMSVQVVNLVEGWQQKQAENPEVTGTEGLLQDMAETTRNLIQSQRKKKFTKASLKCLFEQAWEQKIQESTKERTPWTNCEILYRRRS